MPVSYTEEANKVPKMFQNSATKANAKTAQTTRLSLNLSLPARGIIFKPHELIECGPQISQRSDLTLAIFHQWLIYHPEQIQKVQVNL